MATDETRSAVAHLLRRSGFAEPAPEVDRLADLGYDAVVDIVCDHTVTDPAAEAVAPPTFDPGAYRTENESTDEAARRAAQQQAGAERRALTLWWLQRMVAADRPHREKLTFLWHDHFATSMEKVKVALLMHQQRAALYDLGAGRFDALVSAMTRDPAMLWWLDGAGSTRKAPNENLARELFELFTLGHGGHHGTQPYSEADVVDAARALTGWVIDRVTGQSSLVAGRHDPGTKSVLDTTGALGAEDVVEAATRHPACAPHVVSRLWSRLARPSGPDDPVVQELAAGFAEDLDVRSLLRRIYHHPEFQSPTSRTGLVKSPVELLVGTARMLGFSLDDRGLQVLRGLGQVPFFPPDVAGWPTNEAWLSTASAATMLQVADYVSGAVDVPTVADAAPADRPDQVARLLGIDRWGSATGAALRSTSDDPHALLTVALVSPEHLLA